MKVSPLDPLDVLEKHMDHFLYAKVQLIMLNHISVSRVFTSAGTTDTLDTHLPFWRVIRFIFCLPTEKKYIYI